jgi:hypothetical protein
MARGDWRRPIKELPEMLREAGYIREADRLEREYVEVRLRRLLEKMNAGSSLDHRRSRRRSPEWRR